MPITSKFLGDVLKHKIILVDSSTRTNFRKDYGNRNDTKEKELYVHFSRFHFFKKI